MEYPKKLKDFIEMLQLFPDESQRIELLISYADKFKQVPPEVAKKPYPDENKVPFCESGAYVWLDKNPDNTLKLYFDVENPQGISAKALAALLDTTLSGEKIEAAVKLPDDLVYKIFGQGLSMGKNMGLTGMVQMIQRKAKKMLN
jgi:cysteine desulfuration protein SufE